MHPRRVIDGLDQHLRPAVRRFQDGMFPVLVNPSNIVDPAGSEAGGPDQKRGDPEVLLAGNDDDAADPALVGHGNDPPAQ
ncbi:hypothetical protein GTK09_21195 [Jiella sp. 40Bstr34]|uniref:Uncharacterized protein n=1 Tax=Jiella pacifica TaxID=2696469 RepID=A0A6N9T6B8_9HYPH|nr:hypothetical protein [Jiella pacifica]